MKRKNKIMAALAMGAVALVVASGVARCSLADGQDANLEPASGKPAVQAAHDEGDALDQGAGADAQSGFANLKNTSWESEDGKSVLSIIDGALIETGDAGSSIIYYTVDEESLEGDALTVTMTVSREMTGAEEKTVAVIRQRQDGKEEIICDKLAATYVRKASAPAGPIALTGATSDLFEEFGKGEDEFVSALSDYAKSAVPGATSAMWSKEVWIDYNSKTKLTNFTLDDAASTIVCVQLDTDGKLGAL